MKISYNWLIELTGLDWPVEKLAERLTLSGTACEDIVATSRYLNKVVVGEVTALDKIEGADKIKLATVNTGSETCKLVCGAPNVAVGQKVPVALLGARLAGNMVIKKVKIRGVESIGMICSERELGISDDHSGIMVLDAAAELGTPVIELLDLDDYIMNFELTPNRPDSTSAIGIARDLQALGKVKLRRPTYDIKESSEKASDYIKIEIDDPVGCPRYTARIIKNIKIAESPWWLQKKLITAGLRPINNVVDITNLVMLETGNPLHAFDLKLFGSDRVLVRRARDKEKFTTLDGEKHELTPEVLLITNGTDGVAAAGVMGGLNSEVEEGTNTILLEAAYFDPKVIRKSRKQLGLVTESSTRFEKGADPNNIPFAANRAAYLMQEICGGEVLAGIEDCYPNRIESKKITFRPRRCNALLGTEYTPDRMKEIFVGLDFGVTGSDPMEITVPTFRPDIDREVDLVEEIARIEGYAAIPDAVTNIGPLYTPVHFVDGFEDGLRRLMTASGFDEILGHGLADSRLAKVLNPDLPLLKIVNPVSEDLDVMRNSLIDTALTVVNHNISHRLVDLRLFEIGRVYFPPDKEGNWLEEDRLSLAVSGETSGNWRDKPRSQDFYDLKQAIENLAVHFNWPVISFEKAEVPFLDEVISFKIMTGETEIGLIGEVSDKIAKKFDIKQKVYVAELRINPLIRISRNSVTFKSLPVYPAAPRDLALVVDDDVKVKDIIDVIEKTAGKLAESVTVFDLYSGKQIQKGKKSIGIAITYRSSEKSLASEEVDKLQSDIMSNLKKMFKAEIREK
ncbi:MAG: phenylalanine--tRNA ligase subunit beta [candidate division Zixibacteria bacterium]|nr:phenylalanine--tRNA ligase subunit beta [candidate division Zixibacteria bacterium]